MENKDTSSAKKPIDNQELFKSLEGYEYVKSQLKDIPEEKREAYLNTYLHVVVNGFLF